MRRRGRVLIAAILAAGVVAPAGAGGTAGAADAKTRCAAKARAAAKACAARRSVRAGRVAGVQAGAPASFTAPAGGWLTPAPPAPQPPPVTPPAPPPPPVDSGRVQVLSREYSLTLSRITVPAGPVVVEFNNSEAEDPHDLNIVRTDGKPPTFKFPVQPAGVVIANTFAMTKGAYRLFCALPNHEKLGMKAQLTVG